MASEVTDSVGSRVPRDRCEGSGNGAASPRIVSFPFPESVTVVELDIAPFRCAKDADSWARSHGIIGLMSDVDTGGKGEIAISAKSLNKMLSGSALRKSVTPAIHFAALQRLRDIIRESFVAERHPDYTKEGGVRSPKNAVNRMVDIVVLYGCVSLGGIPYRAKTTLKETKYPGQPTKAYSYEISSIEVLAGNCRIEIRPNATTSMSVASLLNGVTDVNGKLLLDNFSSLNKEQ